jgi:hypothetical protein
VNRDSNIKLLRKIVAVGSGQLAVDDGDENYLNKYYLKRPGLLIINPSKCPI